MMISFLIMTQLKQFFFLFVFLISFRGGMETLESRDLFSGVFTLAFIFNLKSPNNGLKCVSESDIYCRLKSTNKIIIYRVVKRIINPLTN